MADQDFILTQKYLVDHFFYDPESGAFIRKSTGRQIGKNHKGYVVTSIKGKTYSVHRLIWLYVHGRWPEIVIDHINRVRHDNRLCNLRESSIRQNSENRDVGRAISGLKGVVPAYGNKWRCQIGHKGQVIYLGTYDTKEEAHEIYCKASKVFHTNNPFSF